MKNVEFALFDSLKLANKSSYRTLFFKGVSTLSLSETFSPGEGEQVEAIVKWFNLTKGFGFVAPMDHSPDAFLHVSVLTHAGLQQVAEGTKLLVKIGQGPKGRQVTQIVSVLGMAEGGSDGGMHSAPRHQTPVGQTEEMTGTVKWFKADKGFGFVAPDDGGKDVFVHKTVVSRLGLHTLETGQRLKMEVHSAAKGREAVSIEIIS